MDTKIITLLLGAMLFALCPRAEAQERKRSRIGVLLQGEVWYQAIEGLRHGLAELGYGEGRQYVLDIRDSKGDIKAVEEAARAFEREKVRMIYAVTSSVANAPQMLARANKVIR